MGVIFIGGPSGCGKSTIGESLARELKWDFLEGDSVHSDENRAKMAQGVPLQDEDRWPWLAELTKLANAKGNVVVSCSMLKLKYRDFIREKTAGCQLIILHNDMETISEQMKSRGDGHFFKVGMLQSQLRDFELPKEGERAVLTIKCNGKSIVEVVNEIKSSLPLCIVETT